MSKNGSEAYEILVSPICDDVRVQAPEIFPNAQWNCAERVDGDGTVIFLPPPENTTPDEAILLKETRAVVTQQLCIEGDCTNLGDLFTETLNCTLPPEFNFDGLVVIRGDDNIERIFCPNCPFPDAPVEMNCRKAR